MRGPRHENNTDKPSPMKRLLALALCALFTLDAGARTPDNRSLAKKNCSER